MASKGVSVGDRHPGEAALFNLPTDFSISDGY
jgi:hypothetical protein